MIQIFFFFNHLRIVAEILWGSVYLEIWGNSSVLHLFPHLVFLMYIINGKQWICLIQVFGPWRTTRSRNVMCYIFFLSLNIFRV